MPGMSDEEIILTNTYCNSKNKFTSQNEHMVTNSGIFDASSSNANNNSKKRPTSAQSGHKNGVKSISWKK